MSLREQIESDVEGVFLNTDDFAETCTYYPAGGGDPLEVSAVIDEDGDSNEQGRELTDATTLMVFVSRDPLTGISNPRKGDRLRRENDQEDRLFAYQGPDGGPTTEADQFAWTLRFARNLRHELGGQRR